MPGGSCLLELLPVDGALGRGEVAGRLDEPAELGVGDLGHVHPEAVDADPVGRVLGGSGLRVVGAHRELAAGDPDHARRLDLRGIGRG